MPLSPVERMSAVILAKTIASNHTLLDMKGDLPAYIRRLYKYRMFTVAEICDFAKVSEYKVRKAIEGEEEFSAKAGIQIRHLDHLIRMIGSPAFAKLHIKSLLEDGATIASIARVADIPESSLRRWAK